MAQGKVATVAVFFTRPPMGSLGTQVQRAQGPRDPPQGPGSIWGSPLFFTCFMVFQFFSIGGLPTGSWEYSGLSIDFAGGFKMFQNPTKLIFGDFFLFGWASWTKRNNFDRSCMPLGPWESSPGSCETTNFDVRFLQHKHRLEKVFAWFWKV